MPGFEDVSFTPTQVTTNTFSIYCEADMNDGDYINETTELTVKEFSEIKDTLKAVINACEREPNFSDNYWMQDLVPSSEHGVHDPEFSITYIDEYGNSFDVEL